MIIENTYWGGRNSNYGKWLNFIFCKCNKKHGGRSKLGYISDFKIDLDTNKIVSIFLPSSNNKGWFSKEDDIEIPWDKIVKIGVDVIIVDATGIEITQQDENKI